MAELLNQADETLSETQRDVRLLVRAEHGDPFRFLGPHVEERDGSRRMVVRTVQPGAAAVSVVLRDETTVSAERIDPIGIFEAVFTHTTTQQRLGPFDYKLRVDWGPGGIVETPDPYAFGPVLTDFDLHLFAEGTHYDSFEKLGAHVRDVESVLGVHFAVWAPNALRVSVVGNFNSWDGRTHPMRALGSTGLWEIFLPKLSDGEIYKFEIRSTLGNLPFLKADPYAFRAELRPRTGSIVATLDGYNWNDGYWMAERGRRDWLSEPIATYEVHLGSWRHPYRQEGRDPDGGRWLSYDELGDQLIPYVKAMGFTHIELMPVMEHPFDGSWGYQTVGYFAVTSRYGTPTEFMRFVERCHQEGLGVILDWTPAHFPEDPHGLARFDGSHLYEHADPRQGRHPDWGTLVFNYGRSEVQNFLLSNALFWFEKYHVDGLRVDAVASMLYLDYSRQPGEWIPNEYGGRENLAAIAFLKRMNEVVHGRHPGALTIAEESTSWPAVTRPTYLGGLGFSLKWNMGWMNDILSYIALNPVHRKYHHNQITFSMLYAFTENFILPFSHDEVVHGKRSMINKMPGDLWQQFANLRLLYAYFYAHPGKKLLFMGSEFGQRSEWNHDDELEWGLLAFPEHQGINLITGELNALYRREPALHEVDFDWQGFEWIDCNDADGGILSFVRHGRDRRELIVVVASFTPVVREEYRMGVPEPGFYREIFNSDSQIYGGSNVGNAGGLNAEPTPWMGKPYSVLLRLPPLGVIYFKLQRD